MTLKLKRLALLACLAALRPAAAVEGRRCTVMLSPGDDLQQAVDGPVRTSRARIVCLRAGEFRLRRFLSITRDGVVVTGAGASPVLRLEGDTRRVTIEHDRIGASVWDGIALNRTAQARIVGNTIHDNTAAGISTEHLKDSVVVDNVLADNRTHGLYLSDSYHNTIARNRF